MLVTAAPGIDDSRVRRRELPRVYPKPGSRGSRTKRERNSLIGSSVSATTGDYSRGASGFWVERGEIVGPVNECTVAGNLRAMLRSIVAANDARSHLSRVVPSLLVEGLVIAGG